MPALYVVATPIGNLEDITLRAIRTLKEVKLIAAEDTRKTKQLLNAYGIKTPTTSYHQYNKLTKLDYLLSRLQNEDIALVSDAGTPGISDPGFELIAAVSKHNIPVIPIPGPSVLISSLVISGLPTSSFIYLGFLPHRAGERRRYLKSVSQETRTLVFFESPHRLSDSLQDMLEIFGDRQAAVCRELTKLHEETFRGKLSSAIQHFASPRGEFTLIIEGLVNGEKPESDPGAEQQLRKLAQLGLKAREAIDQVMAESKLSRKELYQIWLKIK
jgi:16S rRNA (cytidine1402-2'-O)-methyltransferase